jgi:hypothetical protein
MKLALTDEARYWSIYCWLTELMDVFDTGGFLFATSYGP